MNLSDIIVENKTLEYYRILKWLTRKQKNINEVINMSGRIQEFVDSDSYILYKGLILSDNRNSNSYANFNDMKQKKNIETTIFEWYKDVNTARKNALKKEDSANQFGIVIREEINPKEVIFDLEFLDENNDYFKDIMLTSSLVYTVPISKKFTILEIIE